MTTKPIVDEARVAGSHDDNSVPRQAANDDNSVPRQWRGTTTTTCHINDKARRWHVEDGAWRRRGTMTGHDAMGHDDGDRAQRRWGVMTSGTMDGARDTNASRVPGMFLFFLFFYTPTTFYWQIDYVYRNWQQLWWPIHVQQGSRHVQTCLEPLPMRFIIVLVSYIAFFKKNVENQPKNRSGPVFGSFSPVFVNLEYIRTGSGSNTGELRKKKHEI